MENPSERESCSICLLEFEREDPIRTTPCRHRYHRECIDNWCEAKMSCPICRRELDFSQEIRRIYYAFLRNELRP
jgi:E3 ubiquitin-protein ligase DOA10